MLFHGLLEFFEYRVEIGENRAVVGAFFEHMVEQTDADHKFFGVFVGNVAFGGYVFGHFAKIVMAAEVETHHLFDFSVHNFGDVEVVRPFFLITVTIHSSIAFWLCKEITSIAGLSFFPLTSF